METKKLVSKMRNETQEVKNSIGGHPHYRAVMNTILKNSIQMIGDYDDSRRRTSLEISKIVENKHSKEEIEFCKNTYLN